MNILKRPMFFTAVIFAIISSVSLFSFFAAFIIGTIFLLVCFFVCCKFSKKHITLFLFLLLFLISLIYQNIKIKKVNKLDGEKINCYFLVVSEPTVYKDFSCVTLKAIDNEHCLNAKFFTFDYNDSSLSTGDIVNATLKISKIKPNDKYRLYDYGNGVYATANAITIEKTKSSNKLYRFANRIRNYVKNTVSMQLDSDVSSFLIALTTGDKTLLSDNFLNNVKTTGISHIIVVSGMHISIIMTAVFKLMDRFFYKKYIRSILSVFSVFIISAICGFTMSVTRAMVMFIIAAFAPVFKRENDTLNSLFCAIAVVLVFSPFAIANISFLLSVLSTFAIVWVTPVATQLTLRKFKIMPRFFKIIFDIIYTSFFALVFTMPITIKISGFVSVVSVVTNMLVTYPVTIALVLNVVALLLSAIPVFNFLANFIFKITDLISKLILYIINSIANLPVTVAVLPKSSFWYSMLLIVFIIFCLYFYSYKIQQKRSD